MPELPEVNVIAECIESKILNTYLSHLILHDGSRYNKDGILTLETCVGEPYEVNGEITYDIGGIVKRVFTYGKKIFIEVKLDSDKIVYITSFLAIFGTWRFDKEFGAKHTLVFTNSNGEFKLHYHDTRNWGIFSIVDDYNKVLKDTGCDFFHPEVNLEYFKSYIRNKSPINGKIVFRNYNEKDIGTFLMDQKYVSGVGAYIRSESLYTAKILPTRLLKDINDDEIECLYNAIIDIMVESHDLGGYSMKDYINPFGIKGTFKPKIADKKVDSFGNTVIKTKHGERNIHYVPAVQT